MDYKIKILYVDDELLNLEAFKASFRRQFEIYTARSADEGIEILKNHSIEVVLADQRMPGKTGVDFFEEILISHPNPIRILLTAYSDIKAIIDAINKGRVYRYVTKPWSEFDLKLTIENAYQLYLLKEQNNKLHIKYKEVFVSSTDPIILFDTKGRIIDYNKATLDLIEDEHEALNFSSFNSLIYNKFDAQNIVELFEKNGELNDYECQVPTKKGNLKTCLISGNVITNIYNEIVSYQAIIKDVTKRTKTNQLLLKNTIQTQEQERERISQDLHDGIGQTLIALKFKIERLKTIEPKIEKEANQISKELSASINQLRKVCYNILPPALSEYGLKHSIEQLGKTLSENEISTTVSISDSIPVLEKEVEVALYRIIQEFLSNSVKHSSCSDIKINIYHDSKLNIVLSDNGKGFDVKNSNTGLGINNIISRVKSFNGIINIKSELNKGTTFTISIPIYSNNNKLYIPDNDKEFTKKIDTTTINIGLRNDGLVVIKPKENFKETTSLVHAKENLLALATINDKKKRPIIKYLPEYYINNEAMDYYRDTPTLTSAVALIYQSLTQQKVAELLIDKDDNNIPMNIFNNEDEAILWATQYV